MIYQGYSINAIYNGSIQPTYWITTASVNYSTINGYVKEIVPIITPYGYISVPDDNQGCAYGGVGDFNATAILGYSNIQPAKSNVPNLQKGELCLASKGNGKGNYVFSVRNHQLYVAFTNSAGDVIHSRVTLDENVNTILIDTIAEIASLESKLNTFISDYNLHIHGNGNQGSNTTAPTTTEPSYNPTSNFTRDKSFLGSDGAKNFIDDNGTLIV